MNSFGEMINILVNIKKQMMKNDRDRIWEYYPPNTPSTEANIKLIEKQLGIEIDKEIKEFWLQANGWECFYQMVDLFGTEDMLSEKMDYAKQILSIEIQNQDEFNEGQLLPIAVSRDDKDIFVTVISKHKEYGKVIWFAGGEIERFDSFRMFMNEMIKYCETDMNDLNSY